MGYWIYICARLITGILNLGEAITALTIDHEVSPRMIRPSSGPHDSETSYLANENQAFHLV